MLTAARKTLQRLWQDDSGVVLALTVVVFLSLFLMAVSVYAVGEQLRQRIALQNAADAAAYSGATIQADALNRLAALNQAIAAAYGELSSTEMKYMVGKWARDVRDRYVKTAQDGADAAAALAVGTAPWHVSAGIPGLPLPLPSRTRPTAPIPFSPDVLFSVYLIRTSGDWGHGSSWTGPAFLLKLKGDEYDLMSPAWRADILRLRQEVIDLSRCEKDIQDSLHDRIADAARYVLRANLAGDAETDLHWALSLADTAPSWDNDLPPVLESVTNADDCLKLGGIDPPDTGPGWGGWYALTDPRKDVSCGGDETQSAHDYDQSAGGLSASWSIGWFPPGELLTLSTYTRRAEDVRDSYFKSGCAPQERMLTRDYFLQSGAVAVGVARRVRNPFSAYLEPGATATGLFSLFDASAGDRQAWAVSVARAGYRHGADEGSYDPHATDEWLADRTVDQGNLSISDWDAVLVPIRRAWVMATATGWQDDRDGTADVMKTFALGDAGKGVVWSGLFSAPDIIAPGSPAATQSLGWEAANAVAWDADDIRQATWH